MILIAFGLRTDDGPLLVEFGSSIPYSTKKSCQNWTRMKKLFGSAHEQSFLSRQHLLAMSMNWYKCNQQQKQIEQQQRTIRS